MVLPALPVPRCFVCVIIAELKDAAAMTADDVEIRKLAPARATAFGVLERWHDHYVAWNAVRKSQQQEHQYN
jgi:hypothetical protein